LGAESEFPDWATATQADLEGVLAYWHLDTSAWGTGDAKTLGDLLVELQKFDCELFVDADGVSRRVNNVWIDIFVHVDDKRLHLVERAQRFSDGRVRVRKLPSSLGEKSKVGEDPAQAARRGVIEELGISSTFTVDGARPRGNDDGKSSYPNLRTFYQPHWFSVDLSVDDYRPEGYVEVQPDKSTYFQWDHCVSPG